MAGLILPAIGLVVLCGGCAYMKRQQAKETESLLAAAGFKIKVAETPEKLAVLQAAPQRKIKFLQRQGKTYFGYADASGCGCAYIGNQAAYQKYMAMVEQRRIADESYDAAEVDEDALVVEDDGIWESWGGDPFGGGW